MRVPGIVLVAVGILALLYGGFTYTQQKTVLDVGGLKVSATEHKSVPIPALVGIGAIIGGVLMLMAPAKRA